MKPDKDFELKLSDRETVSLLEDRRNRDVLQPKPPAEAAPGDAEGSTSAEAESANGKNSPPKPEASGFVDRQLKLAVEWLVGELGKGR